jgi:hypothetical protein
MAIPSESIVCKPTPWFLMRAGVIFLMFGGFAGWFYFDATVGYRKKNLVFHLHKTFEAASGDFSRLNADGKLTAEAWKSHAAEQSVAFPNDVSLLPASLKLPMAWPEILHDYDRVKPLNWKKLWLDHTASEGMPADPPEQPYDARKMREQWIGTWVCLALSLAALFVLLRTLGRSIRADGEALTTQKGLRIPYTDLRVLDLRKWDTKGLAYVDYDGSSGKGRARIDGLTYGGFKKEEGEPAEQLVRLVRSRFSGEILEYAPARVEPAAGDAKPSDVE